MDRMDRRERVVPDNSHDFGKPVRNGGRNTALVFAAFFGVVIGAISAPTAYRLWHAAAEAVPGTLASPSVSAGATGSEILKPEAQGSAAEPVAVKQRLPWKPGAVTVPAAAPAELPEADEIVPADAPTPALPSRPAGMEAATREYALTPLASRFDAALPKEFEERLVPQGSAEDSDIDPFRTGSVEPVEVAETEAQAMEIEIRLATEGVENFAIPKETEAVSSIAPAARTPSSNLPTARTPSSNLPTARTTEWVNMRATPDKNAAVIAVVPANATIRAQTGCRHWCEAVYDGSHGYIYKSFLRPGDWAATSKATTDPATEQPNANRPDISELR